MTAFRLERANSGEKELIGVVLAGGLNRDYVTRLVENSSYTVVEGVRTNKMVSDSSQLHATLELLVS